MTIEVLQDQAGRFVATFPVVSPILVFAAILCAIYRRSRWIAPFWIFFVSPIIILFVLLAYLVFQTSLVGGPDGGFVGMGTGFILLFSLFEVIPGILLIWFHPKGNAWGRHVRLPCLFAAAASICVTLLSMPFFPKWN